MKSESNIKNQHLRAEISPARLAHNLKILRGIIGPKVRLCIVAKANCYGHSLPHCLPEILRHADCIATGTAGEALEARRWAPQIPLHVLLPLTMAGNVARIQALIERNIAVTLSSTADLMLLRRAGARSGVPALVHVEVDSGMSRAGVRLEQAPGLVKDCRQMKNVRVVGVFTHLATADENKDFARKQLACFEKTLRLIGGHDEIIAHAAASAATLDLPESHYNLVRIGIAAFGYRPSPQIRNRAPLQGILRLVTRLIQIKEMSAGMRVGYGLTYQFRRAGRLGLIPIGYADGFDRRFSNQAQVKIRGQWVPVRGRVSMDQTSIDLSEVSNAAIGDEVEIISWNRDDPGSVENLAQLMGSIPYEVTTHLGRRIDYQTVGHAD